MDNGSIHIMTTNEYQPFFDFNRDGAVNFLDVITLYYNIPHLI